MKTEKLSLRDGIRIDFTQYFGSINLSVVFNGRTKNEGFYYRYRDWKEALRYLHKGYKESLPFSLKRCLPGGKLNMKEARQLAEFLAQLSFDAGIDGLRAEGWMMMAEFCWRGGFSLPRAVVENSCRCGAQKEFRVEIDSKPLWRLKRSEERIEGAHYNLSAFYEVDEESGWDELVLGRHLLLL